MRIEEAIEHAKEVGERACITDEEKKSNEEHKQLAIWLTELKTYKSMWQDLKRMVLNMADTDTDATQRQACKALYHMIKVYESRLDTDKYLYNKYYNIYRSLYEIEKDIKEDITMINKGLQDIECFKPVINVNDLYIITGIITIIKAGINNKILDRLEKER